MKKCVVSLMLVGMVCGVCFGADGGMGTTTNPNTNGSAEHPWLIEDLADFDEFCGDDSYWAVGVYTRLECDPNLAGRSYTQSPIAAGGTTYAGSFDGNGHTISNLTIDGGDFSGLFGKIESGSSISNLGVENVHVSVSVSNSDNIGGLCGQNASGTINNCYTTGSVEGYNKIGGLCGHNDGGIISGCYSDCMSKTLSPFGGFIGGLCGYNDYGTITDCYATGSIEGVYTTGGLCGGNYYGTISNSYATGSVVGDSSAGGLCGNNSFGTINFCYAIGDVSIGGIGEYVGGLCGRNDRAEINNCYAAGSVSGRDYIGGLCGENTGTISKCYAVGTVSGSKYFDSLAGNNVGSIADCYWDIQSSGIPVGGAGRPKTTAQMKDPATYLGWNNSNWVIDPGNDYPHFTWEGTSGSLITTDYPPASYPGEGSSNSPFELGNASDILIFSNRRCDWDKQFVLTSDIDLSGVTHYYPPTDFSGTLDGQGYAIKHLSIDVAILGVNKHLGFIGFLSGGSISNLGVENFKIQQAASYTSYYIGGLVGYIDGGNISDCYSVGSIMGDYNYYAGGLAGYNDHGNITGSYSSGIIFGYNYIGGLVGYQHRGSIASSYSDCTASGPQNSSNMGGLVGAGRDGGISSSYALGGVRGEGNIGGLMGYAWGTQISNCYSGCIIEGQRNIGGLVGVYSDDYYGANIITNSYSFGKVVGESSFGGLAGLIDSGVEVTGCFWDVETSGIGSSGDNNFGATGKTTLEMNSEDTFPEQAGWDFVTTWWMCNGRDYPRLNWQAAIPYNGQKGLSHLTQLYWRPVSGANSCDVYFGMDNPPTTRIADDITEITFNPGILSRNATYYWQVIANTVQGEIVGDVWQFTTSAITGSGTVGDPYVIEDMAGFDEFSRLNNNSKYWVNGVHTRLASDIDLTGRLYNTAVIAPDLENNYTGHQGAVFSGVFDGDGHIITNLTIDTAGVDNDYLGLFGDIRGSGAEVNNLGLENVIINGGNDSRFLGGLCGRNFEGAISNCSATGTVSGMRDLGGLCGSNHDGSINNCYATSVISGSDGSFELGGLCGYSNGIISSSYATGAVSGGDKSRYLGGLCGYSYYRSINDCYATGAVSGDGNSDYLGGLCGQSSNCTISNCYATGTVSGNRNLGGLCGYIYKDSISNCYATGVVIGNSFTGGVCGYNSSGSITKSYWDVETSGIGAYNDDNYGARGRTTIQMQSKSTFTPSWNFNSIWWMHDGRDYPRLSFQNVPLPYDDQTGISVNAGLFWKPVQNAISYDVYFGIDTPPTVLLANGMTGVTCDPGTLFSDTTYYWQVIANTTVGQVSGNLWQFTTGTPAPAAGPQPAIGQGDVGINTNASWSPHADAVSYDVYFGTDNPPTALVGNDIKAVTYDPGTLHSETTYYWQVVVNTGVEEVPGDLWQFTTGTLLPAAGPQPADGQGNVPINTAGISWLPHTDAVSYDVYFGTDNPPTARVGDDITAVTYDPGTLHSETTYYWQVVVNTGVEEVPGNLWQFTTGTLPPATDPQPADGQGNVPVNTGISWSPHVDAVSYDVYFGTDNPPTARVGDDITAVTYDPGTLHSETTYYWQVVVNTGVEEVPGNIWQFTTGTLSPAIDPQPADGQGNVSINTGISWSPHADAVSYDIYFGTDNPPAILLAEDITKVTYDPGTLLSDTKYYWQVVVNTGLEEVAGDIWQFTTADNKVRGAIPANGQDGVSTNADVSWSPVVDALSYDVYFGLDNPPMKQIKDDITETAFDPGTLLIGVTYYWRVVVNTGAEEVAGDVWQFMTIPIAGGGTAGNPYIIADLAGFDYFADPAHAGMYWAAGVYTKLIGDIDLAGRVYDEAVIAPDTNKTNDNTNFDGTTYAGVFDGNGHVISNLTIDTSGAGYDYLGLFGEIKGSSAEVKNLGIENVIITGGADSDRLGSLCGKNNSGTISNCYTAASVTGSHYTGGLCGYNYGTIINCYTTGHVTGLDGGYNTGGLCGHNAGSKGTISHCYSTASVTGPNRLGGICGGNSGTIINCFWDKETSGLLCSSGGRSLTTVQMKQAASYLGWNNGAWVINDGNDYPHLLWEGKPGSVITTGYPARTYPGDGVSVPFEIAAAADLVCMSQRVDDWDKDFVLTADIDMSGISDYCPIINFSGNFDGNGHTVSNLTVDAAVIGNHSKLGLFGFIDNGANVTKVGLVNVNIIGFDHSYYLGGLCGGSRGTISGCYTTGSITSRNKSYYIGGLAGNNTGGISNCYSSCTVKGYNGIGGLVGWNYGSTIRSYSLGIVIGESVYNHGGLCGSNFSGSISNSFWDTETSGQPGSDGGIGKTTAQMQTESTFTNAGWSFYSYNGVSADWLMPANNYPRLNWQSSLDYDGQVSVESGQNIQWQTDLDIFNIKDNTLTWDLTGYQDCGWITGISPVAGSSSGPDDRTTVTISIDTAISGSGSFECDLILTDNNGKSVTCPLRLHVSLAGSGTLNDPYLIENLAGFDEFANVDNSDIYWAQGVHTRLDCDIDLAGRVYDTAVIAPDNTDQFFFDGMPFEGVFNGDGHIIRNLTIDSTGTVHDYLGLFGKIAIGAVVKKLGVENANIISEIGSSSYNHGSLSGENNGTVSSCYATGSVTGDWATGGLCGGNWDGTIINCYAICTITCLSDITGSNGGLCGGYSSTFINSYAACRINGVNDSGVFGGLCGDVYNNYSFSGCFWDMQVSGISDGVGRLDPDPAEVVGLTTAQMQTLSNFTTAGWDFDPYDGDPADWVMPLDDYPRLAWEDRLVNLEEFAWLLHYWQMTGCTPDQPCSQVDWYSDGKIDLLDLNQLALSWLGEKVITARPPVGLKEFSKLTQYWQATDCTDGQPCNQVDWYNDDTIDLHDLHLLSLNWLGDFNDLQAYKLSPTGHWKFDEASGASAIDSSVRGNDGALPNGGTWWPGDGVIGGALALDGVDDIVTLPGEILDPSQSFSVMLWVNLETKLGTGSQVILQQEGATGRTLLYRRAGDDKLGSYFGSTASESETAVFATTGQ